LSGRWNNTNSVYQSIFLNCICSKNKAFTDRTPKLPQSLAINSDYKRSLLGGLELFEGVAADEVQDLLQRCGRRDLAAD
jgi:hypothetical protein